MTFWRTERQDLVPQVHVATSQEEDQLLPDWIKEKISAEQGSYEFVWLVNDITGVVESGTIVNIRFNMYATFEVMHWPTKLALQSGSTRRFDFILTSDWMDLNNND